jgi:hypothetical protein
MSLNGISAPAALPAANFHPHGHRRGAHTDAGTSAGTSASAGSASGSPVGSVGQLPVGAASGLFGKLLQSLQQAVGAQAAASPQNPQDNAVHSPTNVNTHV